MSSICNNSCLRNREGLHKLLQEGARITEDIVAGMEEKTEELYDALEKNESVGLGLSEKNIN